jgi:hypothetical protein
MEVNIPGEAHRAMHPRERRYGLAMLTIRVSSEERDLLKQAARREELSLNRWVRRRLGLPDVPDTVQCCGAPRSGNFCSACGRNLSDAERA